MSIYLVFYEMACAGILKKLCLIESKVGGRVKNGRDVCRGYISEEYLLNVKMSLTAVISEGDNISNIAGINLHSSF